MDTDILLQAVVQGDQQGRDGYQRQVAPLGCLALQLREVGAPVLRHARRITQVVLVEAVQELGVAAVQGRRLQHAGENSRQANSFA